MKNWLFLFIAIIAEVIATSALKSSEGFTKPIASIVVVLGYMIAFYCLSLTLKTIPVGIAYAVWSGVGIVLITTVAWFVFDLTLKNKINKLSLEIERLQKLVRKK